MAYSLGKKRIVALYGNLPDRNKIFAGHSYKNHFARLKDVSVGSRMVFTDVEGNRCEYAVCMVLTMGGDDAKTMLSDDNWDLTLFTCTVDGKSRVTIRCKLKDEEWFNNKHMKRQI